jgi:uncharacterized protein YacL
MKQTLNYSIKIWLTSVLVSPLLDLILDSLVRPKSLVNLEGAIGFLLLSVLYGIIISSPCWLLLWLSLQCMMKLNMSTLLLKSCLCVVGLVLALLPFFLLFGHDDPITYVTTVPLAISYGLTVFAAIWLYKLKPIPYSAKA